MQLGGDLREIAANIALGRSEIAASLHRLATKVALESATKIAPKIACVNGPLANFVNFRQLAATLVLSWSGSQIRFFL